MAFHPGRDFLHHRHRWRLGAGALCCLLALVVRSETAAAGEAVTRVDTLVVTGASSPPPGPQLGAVVTRIDLAGERGARDLADVLGATAGFQIRRYGGPGQSAVPSLRGSSPAQVRLFVDGMPLDDAQTGLVDLARLPLERFASVDVHRGGVPVRLGGVGGAGAVNLKTRRAAPGLAVTAGAGSWGEFSGRAVWGGGDPEGEGSAAVILHGRRADNDFAYTDHNWTFHNPDDDTERVRENAWLREHGAFAQGHRAVTPELGVRGWLGFLRRDGGRPGPIGGYASPHAQVRYARLDGYLATDWRDGLVRLELSGARGDEQLDDPLGEVGLTPSGRTDSRSEDATGRLSLAPAVTAASWLDLAFRLGVERRGQWYRETFREVDDPLRHRAQTTVFGSCDAALADGRFLLSPSLRWQRNEDDFPPVPPLPWLPEEEGVRHVREDLSPALGAVWEVRPGRLVVAGHASRSVRVPTWIELFGHRGGIRGNRDLQPEEISALDLGVTFRPARGVMLRATVFRSETDSTIIFRPNSQQTSQAFNAGRSVTRGLELEVASDLPAHLQLQGNLTLQEARDHSGLPAYDGKELPYLPAREAFLRLLRDRNGLTPWMEAVFQSANYRDRANTEEGRAPARESLNLGLDWTLDTGWPRSSGRAVLSASLHNITDNRIYDVEGYPLPGRSWRCSVRFEPR